MNRDQGIIYVVLEHFRQHLYPRALEIEKQLDAGKRLSDAQLAHLAEVLDDVRSLQPLIERHPEHNDIVAGVASTYAAIATRAWKNEMPPAGLPENP